MSNPDANKVTIENINHPGSVYTVDADMYNAMKNAFLEILPTAEPGLTIEQLQERIVTHLPETLFPGGAKSDWWAKTVQLDLEAKGIVKRENSRPLRLHRVAT